MDKILVLLGLCSLIAMVAGLIKPGMVIRWGEKRTRPRVLMVYGGLFIVLLIGLGMTGTPNSERDSSQGNKSSVAAVSKNNKNSVSLSVDEAKMRLQAWVDTNKFPSAVSISAEQGKHKLDGLESECYTFSLIGLSRTQLILVDSKTGELFIDDGKIMPLEEWYQKYIVPRNNSKETNKTSADSRLTGRWVANDGTRLEFASNGIASTNLNIWEYPWNQKRDNMNWSANNGRLSLTVSTQMNTSYSITQDNAYGEVLTIDGKHSFKRKQGYGTTGDGLYGVWMPTDSGGNGIQFRKDNTGTNQFSHMGEFTWADIGGGNLRIEYIKTQYFDYAIENGRLIIFTNNGNIVFTKVGS